MQVPEPRQRNWVSASHTVVADVVGRGGGDQDRGEGTDPATTGMGEGEGKHPAEPRLMQPEAPLRCQCQFWGTGLEVVPPHCLQARAEKSRGKCCRAPVAQPAWDIIPRSTSCSP